MKIVPDHPLIAKIVRDLNDRKGLNLDALDGATQVEIIEAWDEWAEAHDELTFQLATPSEEPR